MKKPTGKKNEKEEEGLAARFRQGGLRKRLTKNREIEGNGKERKKPENREEGRI